jgi:hypothetical protein
MMKIQFVFVFFILSSALPWAYSGTSLAWRNSNSAQIHPDVGTTRKPIATVPVDAEVALSPAELDIAKRVYLGKLPCELGAMVTLTADAQSPGYFDVKTKHQQYRMVPVKTSTGTIRLEDTKAGAVWLQLANKSMLMNQKLGIRMADVCMSPDQVAMADKLKGKPTPNLLDDKQEIAIK